MGITWELPALLRISRELGDCGGHYWGTLVCILKTIELETSKLYYKNNFIQSVASKRVIDDWTEKCNKKKS